MASFNVRDFGATGNGTNDDTVAIVAAISSAAAANKYGGAVYFPAGKYLVSGEPPLPAVKTHSGGPGRKRRQRGGGA